MQVFTKPAKSTQEYIIYFLMHGPQVADSWPRITTQRNYFEEAKAILRQRNSEKMHHSCNERDFGLSQGQEQVND